MSEKRTFYDEDFDDNLAAVEDLLLFAADDVPVVHSGLKAQMVTHAQKAQRELRLQHALWGAITTMLLFAGALIWWPASSASTVAANDEKPPQPLEAGIGSSADSVDWALVEAANELRRRKLESLRNAF